MAECKGCGLELLGHVVCQGCDYINNSINEKKEKKMIEISTITRIKSYLSRVIFGQPNQIDMLALETSPEEFMKRYLGNEGESSETECDPCSEVLITIAQQIDSLRKLEQAYETLGMTDVVAYELVCQMMQETKPNAKADPQKRSEA